MSASRRPEAIANYHCACGENPLWDDSANCLYWTDIPAGKVYRHKPADETHELMFEGPVAGGFTLQADGSLLMFGANRIWTRTADGKTRTVAEDIDPDMTRFNDVIADPAGRVYAGTMSKDPALGGLYLVETDGSVRCLFKGTGCANGLAFSPDGRKLYWTDSTAKTIFRFDYQVVNGDLTERRTFQQLGPDDGTPDGMTVDTKGKVYSARWGGSAVFVYSAAAEPVGKIDLPTEKVSSVIFGGRKLAAMYVTTAGGTSDSPDDPAGTLYRLDVGVRGLPEFRSRVQLG